MNLKEKINENNFSFKKKYGQNFINDDNIEVIGISTAIARKDSYDYFNSTLKLGINTNFLMEKDVIDQICERDFYFGIAGSGISVQTNTQVVKAPYFLPFGNPIERASIPENSATYFSNSSYELMYVSGL